MFGLARGHREGYTDRRRSRIGKDHGAVVSWRCNRLPSLRKQCAMVVDRSSPFSRVDKILLGDTLDDSFLITLIQY